MVSRKKLGYWAVLAAAALLFALVEGVTAAPPSASPGSEWRLVFNDEFNGTALDLNKWNTHYVWGRTITGTGELEYYADDAYDFQDGYLRLRAERRSMEGFQYTSGMISSHNKFSLKYGYIEIRARIPYGQGLWPAYWLMPTSGEWPPEIDVLEVLGQTPYIVYMTNHWTDANSNPAQLQGSYTSPDDFSADFHTYAIDWNADRIIWYVDGIERFRTSSHIPQEPMYILATFAVGGHWPGYPDETTPFPSYFDIDYIRVYRLASDLPFPTWLPMIYQTGR